MNSFTIRCILRVEFRHGVNDNQGLRDMIGDGKNSSTTKRFCKTCGCYRTAVSKKKIVDLRVMGETLSCPFCGSDLKEAPLESSRSALDGLFKGSSIPSKKSIPSIFGGSDGEKPCSSSSKVSIFLDSGKEAHFCKDCEFFMFHPYKSYCCKHEKDVSPTDDCMDFSARKQSSK